MMKQLFIVSVALLALAAISDAQSYSYELTVQLGYAKFDSRNGQLFAYLQGGNGRYNHKVVLTPGTESFSTGAVKKYYFSAPYPIEYVEKVVLEWVEKPSKFGNHSIQVDRVVLDPAYISYWQQRQQSIRPFCSATRPQKIKKETQVQFWIRC
ncbi:hypothetical protein HDE_04374 [Halotydeus destructor]|nr:hypothetical protein HDE_04374 [Halotydeus destructor]